MLQVGKTTLIKSLVKHYTRHNLTTVKGPVTVVSGKTRRLQVVECGQELANMVDAAKFADLVLLLVDGNFGFEMETFEFLNILQVHGFPKVMGVLTHLDEFTDAKKLRQVKKAIDQARKPHRNVPMMASTVSRRRRTRGETRASTSVTRIWPPARSVIAAPKVKQAAIR